MNKEELILKIKSSVISVEDAVEIFNWFMQNEYPTTVFSTEYPGFPKIELWSYNIKIDVPKTPQGVAQLNYSIAKIKEFYKI